ncbi:non-specific serine/threonine protein kinase [Pelomyxa schiedti]|nr:non-specific serine/threonine protein kinase [Pelomyxa schiedti]
MSRVVPRCTRSTTKNQAAAAAAAATRRQPSTPLRLLLLSPAGVGTPMAFKSKFRQVGDPALMSPSQPPQPTPLPVDGEGGPAPTAKGKVPKASTKTNRVLHFDSDTDSSESRKRKASDSDGDNDSGSRKTKHSDSSSSRQVSTTDSGEEEKEKEPVESSSSDRESQSDDSDSDKASDSESGSTASTASSDHNRVLKRSVKPAKKTVLTRKTLKKPAANTVKPTAPQKVMAKTRSKVIKSSSSASSSDTSAHSSSSSSHSKSSSSASSSPELKGGKGRNLVSHASKPPTKSKATVSRTGSQTTHSPLKAERAVSIETNSTASSKNLPNNAAKPPKNMEVFAQQLGKGKHGTVTVISSVENELKKFALKTQVIRSPHNVNDASYREWRVFGRLAVLAQRHMCFNFVLLVDWFKVKRQQQFISFVLELADVPLSDVKTLPLLSYQQICFQLVWAIYIAQKETEFVHWDLHSGNILLKKQPDTLFKYKDRKGNTWYTSGWVVKITDFGLSRIKMENGEIIFNRKQPFSEVFKRDEDIESILRDLSKISISEWENKTSDQAVLTSFKKALRKAALSGSLYKVLMHEFFEPLHSKPENFTSNMKITVSEEGYASPQKIIPASTSHKSNTTTTTASALNNSPMKKPTKNNTAGTTNNPPTPKTPQTPKSPTKTTKIPATPSTSNNKTTTANKPPTASSSKTHNKEPPETPSTPASDEQSQSQSSSSSSTPSPKPKPKSKPKPKTATTTKSNNKSPAKKPTAKSPTKKRT